MACAPAAWGAAHPLAGGETRLDLNRGLVGDLRAEGVAIGPLGPAKLKGRRLIMPVTGGVYDRPAGSAALVHSGGLKLTSGGKSVAVRRLTINESTGAMTATVAGKRLRLAELGGVELLPDGFNARVTAKRLSLTGAAVAALNRALRLPELLRRGRSLAAANGLGEASAVEIAFGRIAMGGPETTFSKLEAREVQMGIWGASEKWTAPGETYFLFQIAPTTVPPDASAGLLAGGLNDGISMEIHAPPPRNMLLRGPRVDLASGELSATVSALSTADPVTAPIATLDYSGATFQIRSRVGIFELMGIRAIANQFIVDQLNTRFGTPGMFQAGETLARISITLNALPPGR